ncbi:ABC transporter substrate-binding protein [Clostridium bovifaecis]|uniref:ABC transporter substrate-binding protein n=1 Tax=Clostridium bovifaecis TaxID=2184719 RepID=A0A6I6EVH8_9CLOT|nr:ABC transporter substrate-binding protein [Clostridium bovifaecis]
MRKKLLGTFLTIVLIVTSIALAGCNNKDSSNTLQKIKLNEVVRSVFYAPMYVALNEGFFKEEGLDIELSTGQGADKTMQQVLSGSVDIGFCGPEQVIYIYNQKRQDLPILFAQLTQTDGSFLVGRNPEKNFDWKSLKGKTIIGGRPGGVPQMTLEYVLKKSGLEPGKDVTFITNLDFTATAGAFKAGTGEYVALFEPTGSMLEKDKSGYIVDSIGKEAGNIAYTCFFATKSYMEKNPEVIEKFTNAIYKGQLWVANHSDEEVAKSILSFFPGSDLDIIINVIKNYRSINAFASDPTLKEADLNKLMDIIQGYKQDLIKERPAFDTIVNNSYAEKVLKK